MTLGDLFRRKRHIPFLVTGHPRCGTTSAAEACTRIDIDLRSEAVGRHGISSWMMAVDDWKNPFGDDLLSRSRHRISWDKLILVVRDPRQAVPSVIIENTHSAASYAFRSSHIKQELGIDLDVARDPLHAALLSICCWTDIILQQKPDFAFRIEDEQPAFLAYLAKQLGMPDPPLDSIISPVWVNAQKTYGGVQYEKPSLTEDAWKDLDFDVRARLQAYCKRFGYAEASS